MTSASTGTRQWWKITDNLSSRKTKPHLALDSEFITTLNDYFVELCHDDQYLEPTTSSIDRSATIPPHGRAYGIV